MNIDKFVIGSGQVFVIAEIGNNHNGSYERAIEMIDKAIDAGVDCVKFQMRNMTEVYRKRSLEKQGEDLGTEYILDLLERFELSVEEHKKLAEYSASKNILYLCTPWDLSSVSILEDFGVKAFKVASADLTNMPLLNKLAATGLPLIMSTGMSTSEEIKFSADYLTGKEVKFAMLHCNSTYPAPLDDINLKWIKKLKKIHPIVGYSGHERGTAVSLAAVALGATIIERHFTLNREMEGPDHAASLEFDEFKLLVDGIRQVEKALGDGKIRQVSQGEMINRENLAKSLVANSDLKKGMVISADHIKIRSPGQGLSPQKFEELIGKTLQRDIADEEYFYPSDLNELKIEARNYKFSRPWGIPVRYHDFSKYLKVVQPDFVEFHMSYKDLDLDIKRYLKGTYNLGFVVHAPELFSESRLMDLTSPDKEYYSYSLKETQRVINITRSLKKYFPSEKKPMIVANIGGFSMDEPLTNIEVQSRYERFASSLSMLDLRGVELIPQTMAPFPWHFGGQRFQNLFVHADEIVKWCKKLNLRICFDLSHSKLTCNHFGVDFYEFAEKLAPYTGHLHFGDALGVNGEGLQIGEGDIDFTRLSKILNFSCPNASFIPEIWQGHKNGGEGFWLGLDRLEKMF
ncbi:N-acetylneuraminate synthase family protein [Amylibacter sp.]|nr:N-acetylneuraminate synthase family protein [Amylibacter sp.]